ncbi:hypothetical protein DFS34DRAFT_75434 [Phlyctochytrium arcticum]|nr:hypothetical protein DFS34DRAFT_75434 [Phlyctochytrium arcticum]
MHLLPRPSKKLRGVQGVVVVLLLASLVVSCGTYYHQRRSQVTYGDSSTVPRIIHQYHQTGPVPEMYQEWSNSWQLLNPGYTYHLWTSTLNRHLIHNHYPFALASYDSLPSNLQPHMAIYALLHRYGGVYADLKVEALRPLDGLMKGKKGVWVAEEGSSSGVRDEWMMSTRGHSVWMTLMSRMMMNGSEVGLKTGLEGYLREVDEADPVTMLVGPVCVDEDGGDDCRLHGKAVMAVHVALLASR